ncbi:endonuclease NucS domain-containing protein [Alkaliphilus sp. B6464]|uniref:endonuclease NucS domain-containing protein n=1 Tax=Alkaliphilus sp. B6464 TaxID=2731219 RepID=UPI001BA63D36|nr:endonuclease NucS domain-containing protein [Alkaliphilus sp. B6464]QUH21975.1 DUF91 domain-containing protein [Alkaliphilus sp. B6464]
MESLLQEKIVDELKYMYNKSSEHETMMIFFIRYMIYFNNKKIDTKNLIEFLIRELNMPNQNGFHFYDTKIYKRFFQGTYSLENIVDDFSFRHLEMIATNLKGQKVVKKEILKEFFGKYKVITEQKFKYEKKTHPYYQFRYKHFMLFLLYNDFEIMAVNSPRMIEGVTYPLDHNDFALTIDEYYCRYEDIYNAENEKSTEKEVEDYIVNNRGVLEGFKVLKRQYEIDSGIIDLLCEDEQKNKVVVELKANSRPKDLTWQLNAYTKDVKKIFKDDNIRKVAVTPMLDKPIIDELKEIDAELYYFEKRYDKFTFIKQF